VRRNLFYGSGGPGLVLYADSSGTYDPRYAHVVHNVFYQNGISPLSAGDRRYTFGMTLDNVAGANPAIPITDVAIKNNLFRNGVGGDLFFYWTDPDRQTVVGNYFDVVAGNNSSGSTITDIPAGNVQSAEDPLFADVSAPLTVENVAAFDFDLLPGSPAIDQGVFLTAAVGAGAGTILPVADAGYFTDGFGVTDGDLIQLEGQTATARIVAVDYAANTLTLDAALTWTGGQGVSLAYNGPAPDIGAYETP
jgi:hypothetical protein